MTTCVLYLRVSTDRQTTDNQRPDLEQLAARRGLAIVDVVSETSSAAKTRPRLDDLLLRARRGKVGAILVWSIDRLGRSMVENLNTVIELDRLGVAVLSVREPWLDTDTQNPTRQLVLAVMSWVSEQERARLIERTRAGIDRARKEGKQLGRPRVALDLDRARALRAAGQSIRQIAATVGVSPSTLHRVLA